MSTKSSKPHQSLRLRDHIAQATEALLAKEREFQQATMLQAALQGRIDLLQNVTAESSLSSILQQLALRALTMKQQLLTAGITRGSTPPDIRALPLDLSGYDEAVLATIAGMTFKEGMLVQKSFLARAQPLALMASCHGQSSSGYSELCDITQRFVPFISLHSLVNASEVQRHLRINLETGEQGVPSGWYERVADLLPVHAEFARLAATAVAITKQEQLAELPAFQQRATKLKLGCSDTQRSNLLRLGELLEEYSRKEDAAFVYQLQIMCYVLMSLTSMQGMPLHKVSMVLASCWPYWIDVRAILLEYLSRPEVAALSSGAASASDRQAPAASALDAGTGAPLPAALERGGSTATGNAARQEAAWEAAPAAPSAPLCLSLGSGAARAAKGMPVPPSRPAITPTPMAASEATAAAGSGAVGFAAGADVRASAAAGAGVRGGAGGIGPGPASVLAAAAGLYSGMSGRGEDGLAAGTSAMDHLSAWGLAGAMVRPVVPDSSYRDHGRSGVSQAWLIEERQGQLALQVLGSFQPHPGSEDLDQKLGGWG